MFSRKECKLAGKEAFVRMRWLCVLVALVLFVCAQGLELSYSVPVVKNIDVNDILSGRIALSDLLDFERTTVKTDFTGTLIEIFALNIFVIGGSGFFAKLFDNGEPSLSELVAGFKGSVYGRNLITMFLRNLFTVLWTLLFIIPGIIKSYEYSMIPYILADDPTLDRRAAFARSKELTQGSKWALFVFDLSFVGWWLLSGLTLGILNILYVSPYYNAAKAKIYLELKAQH